AGVARNGVEAIKLTQERDPDVITMDINMPEMDGITALEYIMNKFPRPVVMISILAKKGAEPTLKALELGAVDFITKPSRLPTSISQVQEDVIRKIKDAAGSRAKEIWERARRMRLPGKVKIDRSRVRGGRAVIMGASAGGPRALAEILPSLPEDLPAFIAVVQHMPGAFVSSFAERLDSKSSIEVKKAVSGEEMTEGKAIVVPGGQDMVFEADNSGNVTLQLLPTVARRGASPVIDVTMESASRVFEEKAIGVLLSGMGSDGAMGLGMIKDAGGTTIAQDKDTCLVYGMPRAAIERRLVDIVVPVDRIAAEIIKLL
ncbi:MAG: chemotaxis-specific protein-glutamate methyltransferase CheB, partial [Actinobacteria bacterium]|nr:chemotaxis-specific protein-glutamate methyltransferase CheB [Actinomycetota bacterium]